LIGASCKLRGEDRFGSFASISDRPPHVRYGSYSASAGPLLIVPLTRHIAISNGISSTDLVSANDMAAYRHVGSHYE